MAQRPTPKRSPQRAPRALTLHSFWLQCRHTLAGLARLCSPSARGVYHPQSTSPIVLGVALPPDSDFDAIERRLWWRGLGLIDRDDHIIAGADVTQAARRRHLRAARTFVTRQLRDADVRGPVKRWE